MPWGITWDQELVMELPPLSWAQSEWHWWALGKATAVATWSNQPFPPGKKLQLLLCPAQLGLTATAGAFSQSCRELRMARRSLNLAVPLSWLYPTKHFQLAALLLPPTVTADKQSGIHSKAHASSWRGWIHHGSACCNKNWWKWIIREEWVAV